MTPKQLHILRHSLGLDRSTTEYRNHYAIGEDCDGYADVLALVDAGLMVRGQAIPDFERTRSHFFHVTDAGREAVRGAAGEAQG